MIKKLSYFVAALGVSLGLLSVAQVSSAHTRCYWVKSHYHHGHHMPAHKVCYGHRDLHCKWVPSHYRHGVHYPAHRVCWYRY